eukprot:CAMPEP_0185789140 /NCGR_PEP_ID=MMETSP1174-20130828/149485_1 /TAXON_ID=35687 /ORGANISM="Dictyocha speculum, Strain CCMP1381" /LENGTH=50 /DNA_ID=CAMNT_0028483139 /DNA_START=316 /DNA_END=468 /DNA_ORIENTATION=-
MRACKVEGEGDYVLEEVLWYGGMDLSIRANISQHPQQPPSSSRIEGSAKV